MAVTATPRLGLSTLNGIRPLIRPGDAGTGIVHMGLGAFHRAHQAVFTEDAIAAGGGDWGIVGVAPRSPEVVAAIAAQDNLFSVTTLSGAGSSTRVVGALSGVRHAPADPGGVVALLADPAVRIVTLTITEKGYRPGAAVPEYLVRGLIARQRSDAGPIALVSCDNLPANGRHLRGVVTSALRGAEPAVLEWVAANVTFPGTMVDRIVPATTPRTLATAAAALGARDLAAVGAEPYTQWVVEDDFPAGRPAWERAGVVMTGDAGPWERLKLRTLNGVHSAIAYLGALAGRDTIADALEVPGMVRAMRCFIAEDVALSLSPPDGVSVVEYGDEVLGRFANPAIGHRTVQVAMDGSQKLPQRVLHTIQDRRAAGAEPRWGALVVAAWIRFVQGAADDGRSLPLDDPLAADLRTRLASAPATSEGAVSALLGMDAVFPPGLAADETVRALVTEWLTAFARHGVAATLAGLR
jgi:fructuronate reductase